MRRKLCILCNLQMEHHGEPYHGIRVPRGKNKLVLLAQNLGTELNSLPNFSDNDEFCHRHYDNFEFEIKEVRQKQTRCLKVPDNVMPKRTQETRGVLKELHGNISLPHIPSTRSQRLNPPGPSPSAQITSSPQDMDYTDNFDQDVYENSDTEQHRLDAVSMEILDDGLEYSAKKAAAEVPNFLLAEGKQLMELFKFCFDCGSSVTAEKKIQTCGTAVIIKFFCNRCKCYKKWRSQSRIGDTKRYIGNVLVPSTAVTTPISHSALLQFSKTLGLPMIKWSAFNLVARNTFTVIDEEYSKMKTEIINDLLEKQNNGEETKVCADAQFDSRGYSAKQGWETIMCAKTKRVIAGHVLENKETGGNSSAMEVEGLRRGLQELSDLGINVSHLTTDRSKSVASMVKAEFSTIIHQWDPWHWIKSVQKEFREATKLKTAPEMIVWLSPILNHLWHSVTFAEGDGKLCAELMFVPLMHTLGIHEWTPGTLENVLKEVHSKIPLKPKEKRTYLKNNPEKISSQLVKEFQITSNACPHSARPPTVEQGKLPVTSKTYNVILKTLTKEHLFKDMQKLSPYLTTANLENLHSQITNKYRSKNVYYPREYSESRIHLAYFDHNKKIEAEMMGERKVIKRKMRRARHRGGEFVMRKIKSPNNYSWKINFNNLLLEKYKNRQVIQPKKKQKSPSEAQSEESATENEYEDEDLDVNDFDAQVMQQIVEGEFPSELATLFDTEKEENTSDSEEEKTASDFSESSDDEQHQEI